MKTQNFAISKVTFNAFVRYQFEILLDMNESILKSSNPLVKEAIFVLGEDEMYQQFLYHQKILINFIYFQEEKILINHIKWLYRVYYSKGLDLNYFLYEFNLWIDSCKGYFDVSSMIELEKVYLFLINNHENFKANTNTPSKEISNSLVNEIYDLLLNAKKEEVLLLSNKYSQSSYSFSKYFTEVFSEVMNKIGTKWEASEISVAKEHIASSTLEEVSFELIQNLKQHKNKNMTVLLANCPNEHHSISLKVCSKLLKKDGYDVICTGANTPKKDILKTVEEFNPDFVMLSVALSSNLFDIANIVNSIKLHNKKIKIIVGGNAFASLDKPNQLLNADIYCKNIDQGITFINGVSTLNTSK